MTTKINLNIIDGNSLGYAAHRAMRLSSGELETQAVFGMLKTMREIAVAYPDYTKLVLWDGRAQWRFDMYEAYKSNRDNDPKKVAEKEAYAKQKPHIYRMLKTLGVRQLTVLDQEADDMAGHFVAKLAPTANHIELITGDEDWLQLVRKNVSWRDMRDDTKRINLANFYKKTLYANPMAFLEGKCLTGDTSDVISGVGGIGEGSAPEFLATWGSVRHFFEAVDKGTYTPKSRASKTAKSLHPEQNLASPEGRALFARNLRLMQLVKPTPPEKSQMVAIPGQFDKEAFAELCEELAFVSVLRSLDAFIEPFKP